jgi:hypothetical protein
MGRTWEPRAKRPEHVTDLPLPSSVAVHNALPFPYLIRACHLAFCAVQASYSLAEDGSRSTSNMQQMAQASIGHSGCSMGTKLETVPRRTS